MKHLLYTYILLLLFLTACESTITYQGEYTPPRLVMQSQVEAGADYVVVYMSRSAFFVDAMKPHNYAVEDARVVCRLNQEDSMVLNSGTVLSYEAAYPFTLPRPLRAGDTLYISASRDGYPSVSSRAVIPPAVQLLSPPTFTFDTLHPIVHIRFALQSYPTTDAMLGVYVKSNDMLSEIYSRDPIFDVDGNAYTYEYGYQSYAELLFRPSSFTQGHNVTLHANWSPKYGVEQSQDSLPTISFHLVSYSLDSYQYMRSMANYMGDIDVEEMDLGAMLGSIFDFGQQEKAPIYTNIQNGYGIIITKNTTIY